jgi:hypothetical protein
MGRTFNDNARRFDDDFSSGRSGKHHKHSNNRKTGGLKTLNSYVEEDYYDITFDSDDELDDNNDASTDTNT